MEDNAKKIEALLFVAGEAVSKKDLAKLIEGSEALVQESLQELEQELMGDGLSLVQTATHAQLVTAPAVSNYLAQFLENEEAPLSKPASEVLALVAYRGPISRLDIEAIRGVDCRQTLRSLKFRGFIAPASSGTKVPLYDITEDFFQHLGITKREELPNFDNLSTSKRIQEIINTSSGQL